MPARSDGSLWIKLKKILRRDAEQSRVRFVLRHFDGWKRGPVHPAECLEIPAVIENRYVLGNGKLSGFCHRCIHHFLCQLRRDTVFLDQVSHWNRSST
jgi:hypothetical protein